MNPYKEILREFFSKYVSTLRKRRGLTQEEMAEKLRITGRAYSDLERGIYCFSAVALVFLLLMLEEGEIKELLSPLREEIEKSRAERWRSDPWRWGIYTGFCAGLAYLRKTRAFFTFRMLST